MASSTTNQALFEIQRFQILQTKLNPQTESLISDEYAYAWQMRLYPYFSGGCIHEAFKDSFSISEDQVDTMSDKADSDWQNNKYNTFYEYESYFTEMDSVQPNGIDRLTLMAYFRYSFLLGHFDDQFWETLLKPMQHPTEATMITKSMQERPINIL